MQITNEDNDCEIERSYNESERKALMHHTVTREANRLVMDVQVNEGVHALSDRILIVKIVSKPLNLWMFQVYSPSSASSDKEIEKFYDDL